MNVLRRTSWSPYVVGAAHRGAELVRVRHRRPRRSASRPRSSTPRRWPGGRRARAERVRLHRRQGGAGKAAEDRLGVDARGRGLRRGVRSARRSRATARTRKVPPLWEWRFGPSVPQRDSPAAFLGGALMMFGARLAAGLHERPRHQRGAATGRLELDLRRRPLRGRRSRPRSRSTAGRGPAMFDSPDEARPRPRHGDRLRLPAPEGPGGEVPGHPGPVPAEGLDGRQGHGDRRRRGGGRRLRARRGGSRLAARQARRSSAGCSSGGVLFGVGMAVFGLLPRHERRGLRRGPAGRGGRRAGDVRRGRRLRRRLRARWPPTEGLGSWGKVTLPRSRPRRRGSGSSVCRRRDRGPGRGRESPAARGRRDDVAPAVGSTAYAGWSGRG